MICLLQVVSIKILVLKQVTVGGNTYIWDTSNVKSFDRTFQLAKQFNQDISNKNISSAIILNGMFGALVFDQDISTKQVTVDGNTYTAWDTSNVQSMTWTFSATSFNPNISNWNTSKSIKYKRHVL